jgi:hypothetical protein
MNEVATQTVVIHKEYKMNNVLKREVIVASIIESLNASNFGKHKNWQPLSQGSGRYIIGETSTNYPIAVVWNPEEGDYAGTLTMAIHKEIIEESKSLGFDKHVIIYCTVNAGPNGSPSYIVRPFNDELCRNIIEWRASIDMNPKERHKCEYDECIWLLQELYEIQESFNTQHFNKVDEDTLKRLAQELVSHALRIYKHMDTFKFNPLDDHNCCEEAIEAYLSVVKHFDIPGFFSKKMTAEEKRIQLLKQLNTENFYPQIEQF